MEYSINELSKLAGVSARTLRYYDETGLLCPSRTNDSGYRFYGPGEVELLQQILFYRERGLSLDKIKHIIYDDDFDSLSALYEHLESLKQQKERISSLICTVNTTIASMKGELFMKDIEKFEAFKQNLVHENEQKYGSEIRESYGNNTIDEANQKLLNMTPEDYQRFETLKDTVLSELETAVTSGARPESDAGRKAALLHKEWLGYTWKEYSAAAHQGLVSMYLADMRFKDYYDRKVSGCAQFLVDAVMHWSERLE